VDTGVQNRLGAIRRARGIGAADLASRVGVSRQTVYAIEAGTYVPNTQVALKLARELDVAVEELFSLEGETANAPKPEHADVLSAAPPFSGQAVRVARVGDRLVGIPVSSWPYFLYDADGTVEKSSRGGKEADLVLLGEGDCAKRLVVAGCDPAVGLLAGMVERVSGVQVVPAAASSRLALEWLREGKVHVAGTHLKDAETGEFNVPILRRRYPHEDFAVVTFAVWEEGLVTAAGNPKGIREAAQLVRRGVRFVNREEGSGSRALLDRLLAEAGVPGTRVAGYDRIGRGHLDAAYAVSAGEADCCIATRSAARSFGLDFVPLQTERYDLVMRRETLDLGTAQGLLDVLQKAALRRKLEALAGYDTSRTGSVIA
jgi:putative molybdopterin biosynthesis protein